MENKPIDMVSAFEKLAKKANRVGDIKSPKRRYNAIHKIYAEWHEISKEFLLGRVTMEEILGAYTNLDTTCDFPLSLSQESAMDNYFTDFARTLDEHTDRMFFNAWMRCQICILNALEHGCMAFEKENKDGSD